MALTKSAIVEPGVNLSFIYPDFAFCTKNEEVVLEDAYHKIKSIKGDKNKIDFILAIYPVKDGVLITTKNFSFIPTVEDSSDNFIKQGYEYLKLLPEFIDAVDC